MLAQSFCRKFVWHRECLWPQELPAACMLVLAAEDDLVPSKLVREMLQNMGHPCEVGCHPLEITGLSCWPVMPDFPYVAPCPSRTICHST